MAKGFDVWIRKTHFGQCLAYNVYNCRDKALSPWEREQYIGVYTMKQSNKAEWQTHLLIGLGCEYIASHNGQIWGIKDKENYAHYLHYCMDRIVLLKRLGVDWHEVYLHVPF